MRLRWHLLLACLVVGVLIALVVPAMTGRTNCGGNSAALACCKEFLILLERWQEDHPGEDFCFETADPKTQRKFKQLAASGWISHAELLARLDKVRYDPASPQQVAIVCDQAYTNVPRYMLLPARPTHAVGYTTGKVTLINPSEFAKLDLSGFVDLQPLQEWYSYRDRGSRGSF